MFGIEILCWKAALAITAQPSVTVDSDGAIVLLVLGAEALTIIGAVIWRDITQSKRR